MTTIPDPQIVADLARKVADRALHDNVHVEQWVAAVVDSELGGHKMQTRVAYSIAVGRRLATVKPSWPDEQPQHVPLTAAELAELTASIEHLSGPDAWDEARLEPALVPVTHYVPRLLAMVAQGQVRDDGDVRAVAERCPCGCVGGPDDCTCGLDCHCTDCLTCDSLAAVRRAIPDERDGDEDHRGDEAKDCPACSAFRHQTEQVLDVRAVAALLKLGDTSFRGNWLTDYDDARSELARRFADRIAALEARDAKAADR